MLNPFHLLLSIVALASCSTTGNKQADADAGISQTTIQQEGEAVAYFAAGCFWCVEAIYESVEGVREAVSGYAGGKEKNPSYQQVSSGRTGHAEAVMVLYDPKMVTYETLLEVYYGMHNPTTVNGQHPDYGTQYRSVIFYQNEAEHAAALNARNTAQEDYDVPIATEIVKFETFWPAEDYHQDYERLHPDDRYVQSVSIPRLNRFKTKFPHLLKKK